MTQQPQLLHRSTVEPESAQVQLSDPLHRDYPQWPSGREAAVADAGAIAVATCPADEGDVAIEVWAGSAPADDRDPHLVLECVLAIGGPLLEVGTGGAGPLGQVLVDPGAHRVRVLVDEPGYASSVRFVID